MLYPKAIIQWVKDTVVGIALAIDSALDVDFGNDSEDQW